MMRRILRSVLASAFIFAACGPAWAGDAADESAGGEKSGVFTLGQIEVVGRADKTPNTTVETVTQDEIRLFEKKNLAEAVNLLPGVTLTHGGQRNELMLSVRGFDIKHVPIYIDGIPVYVPYDGYPDLGRFTTFDLSEIVVSKGFSSVLYGPNTMGGAINMISRRPVKAVEIDAGAGYATGETYNAYANIGTNQGLWYFQGGASYYESSYYELSDDFEPTATEDGGERENSYRTDRKFSFKLGLTPRGDDEYAISYISQHGEKGTPPYTGTDPSVSVRYWRWPSWDKESYYFNSKTALGQASYVKTRLFYDMFDNVLYSYDDDTYTTLTKKSSFKSYYDDHTAGGSIELGTRLVPRNSLKLAFHYKRDVHKEHNLGSPVQRFEDEIYSLGLEDTVDIFTKFYAIAGASWDRVNTLEAEDYDSKTGIMSDFEKGDTSVTNPQLGLFYEVSENGVIHATVAGKSRIPSIKDKYSYKMGKALPNPDLDAETAINYEIGYQRRKTAGLTLEAALYYSDISDFILSVTIPDPSNPKKTLLQNQNIESVEQYGFEIGLSGPIFPWLAGGANYTYFYSKNKTNELNELINVPCHKVIAFLTLKPFERLAVTADVEYDSKRLSSSDSLRVADEFFLANGKVSFEVGKGVTLEAGAANIFDEDYALDEGFPEPGRSFFGNVRYVY